MHKDFKVGTICYDVHSGLGHLAKSFFDAGIIDYILVIPHPDYPRYPDWYPPDRRFHHQTDQLRFLDHIDSLLVFENAFSYWQVVREAKLKGIKFSLMPMYEYSPFPTPVKADLYICPSLLDVDYYKPMYGDSVTFLPVPSDAKWKLRTRARVFVHNAGHGGHGYRNGTPELLEAMKMVKSPIELIVRGQPAEGRMKELLSRRVPDERVKVVLDEVPDNDDLWSYGDVMIAPEKFNGLSLPLQEAWSSGLMVMTTDRYPMNTWLPKEPLIPVHHTTMDRISVEFERSVITPEAIAQTIDRWYDQDISQFSRDGKEWGERHDWKTLKPKYIEALTP